MNRSEIQRLAARHLRFERDLLALWHHTCHAPTLLPPERWASWVARRRILLHELETHNGPRLAADTAAAVEAIADRRLTAQLAALHGLEVAALGAILRLDARARVAATRQLGAISDDLRAIQRAQMARREYRAPETAVRRLSRRG